MEELLENKQKSFINFIKNNKKKLLTVLLILVIFLSVWKIIDEIERKDNIKISEEFNHATALIKEKKTNEATLALKKIIRKKNKFYSPSSLNLIIDNDLELKTDEMIDLFDHVLKIKGVDKELKNLMIIKKSIFVSESSKESDMLDLLNPILQSDSVWKKNAAQVLELYFFSKNEKEKAKEYRKYFNDN